MQRKMILVAVGFSWVVTGWLAQSSLAAGDTYRDTVLADNPLAYYEFEEAVGATVAVDSSPNGNDSLFLGSRTQRKLSFPGASEAPGLNVVFGGAGRAGNAVEFLNRDSVGWANATDNCGPFIGDCEAFEGGGYIKTGVNLNIGDADNDPSNGAVPGDWSFEISIKDDDISNGPDEPFQEGTRARTFAAQIISQPMTGGEDISILAVRDVGTAGWEGTGDPADRAYVTQIGNDSQFVETTTFATTTRFDPTTPETNAGNPLTFQGQWETIVLSYQASTQEVRWYSEGQLIRTVTLGSDTGTTPAFSPIDDPWTLAAHYWFGDVTYFSGEIDEFSVYEYRLDDPNGDGDMSDSRVAVHFAAISGAGAGVEGDYNGNGIVDAADYTLWRDSLGSTSNLDADGDGSGTVDAADYDFWKARFGNTSGSGLAAGAAVPEPASWLLACVMAIAAGAWRCRARTT